MKLCAGCGNTFERCDWVCPVCGHTPQVENGIPLLAPEFREGDGTDAAYNLPELFGTESQHFWFQSRRQALVWAVRRYFPGARSFFELGCGTGFVMAGIHEALPSLQLCGSEVLVRALDYARRRLPGVPLLQMDARRMPFRNEFDVIGAFDVLEHVTEDELVLAEIAGALRPGGGVVLTVPQHPFLWTAIDEYSGHRRRYSRADLVGKLRRQGFRILRATSLFSLVLPLLLISRMRRQRPEELDPLAELRIGTMTNRVLSALLSVERSLIRAGVSLPAGGSLLVVAQKVEAGISTT
jgi:SAM-dependent methyltransferase